MNVSSDATNVWHISSGGAPWLLISTTNLTLDPVTTGAVVLAVDQAVAATMAE